MIKNADERRGGQNAHAAHESTLHSPDNIITQAPLHFPDTVTALYLLCLRDVNTVWRYNYGSHFRYEVKVWMMDLNPRGRAGHVFIVLHRHRGVWGRQEGCPCWSGGTPPAAAGLWTESDRRPWWSTSCLPPHTAETWTVRMHNKQAVSDNMV